MLKQALTFSVLFAFTTNTSWATTLKQSVITAINYNHEFKQQNNRYRASQEGIKRAKAGWYPTVDLLANYSHSDIDSALREFNNEVDYSTRGSRSQLRISEIIYEGNKTVNDIKQSQFDSQADYWNTVVQMQDLTLDLISSYLDVNKAKEFKTLTDENVVTHEKTLEQIRRRKKSGLGTGADISQINGRLARAMANQLLSSNNVRNATSHYIALTGEHPESLMPIAKIDALPESQTTLLAMIDKNNPLMKVADHSVDAADSRFKLAGANMAPRVTLDLVGTKTHFEELRSFTDEHTELKAELSIQYNLFNGGRDRANKLAKAHEREIARDRRNQTLIELQEQARIAWDAKESLARRLTYLKVHQDESLTSKKLFQKQFQLGKRSLLDLLDTENELFRAQQSYISSSYDYLLAQYRVLHSAGRLLDSLGIDPASFVNQD